MRWSALLLALPAARACEQLAVAGARTLCVNSEAFALAKGVYEARGAHRLTMITEKNLARVERLLEIAKPKDPPPLPWEPKDYAPHLADEPKGGYDDDEEEGDMSVYDAPSDDDDGTDGKAVNGS